MEIDPILSGMSIWQFRHLELQNPLIISDFRHRSRKAQEQTVQGEQTAQREIEQCSLSESDPLERLLLLSRVSLGGGGGGGGGEAGSDEEEEGGGEGWRGGEKFNQFFLR